MGWLREFRRRLAVLLRGERFARDLEEEMGFHLEMQAEENRGNGMVPEEARYAAKRQFGNLGLAGEDSREVWHWNRLDTLVQDVRFALRMARRNAAFTALVVFTLALGIGANTAVFSLVEAIVLRPLPYPESERLFMLWTVGGRSQRGMNTSYPDFHDWRQQSRTFEGMAAIRGHSFNLTGGAEPERVDAIDVTPGLFELLGVKPALGRTFAEGEDEERVVLLDHRLWMRRFGGNPNIVGQTIRLDGRSYSVIGVLPPGFRLVARYFVDDPLLFVPLAPYADRTNWSLRIVGRLTRGASPQQAQAEMNAIAARLAQAYPVAIDRRQGIVIEPLREYASAGTRRTALLLLGAVSFVLLIACANVANLLLSRGAARRREIAIRMSIGAGRGRLVRQLLTESVLLAGSGGVLGIVFAWLGLPLLAAAAPARTELLARLQDTGVQLNSTVLAFTVALSITAGMLFGILPAWKSTQPAAGSARSSRAGRLRGSLIALEVALSFVLLAGAGLMMKTLVRLLEVDLGFSTERLLTMATRLPESKYPDDSSKNAFFGQILARLETLPGVRSVGAVRDLPLARGWSVNSFETEGEPVKHGRALYHSVSPGYFETMGIPLLRGRFFTERDSESAPAVAVVSRTMARRYWPGRDPIGKAVLIYRGIREQTAAGIHLRFEKQRIEIVGVVGDVRHYGLDADPPAELFMPYLQYASGGMTFVVRSAVDPGSLIPLIRREVARVDPDQPVTDVQTMKDWVSVDIAPRRFVLLLIGIFAAVAVGLAAAGIYGVISYSVAQRTQEIGIRLALGAGRRRVVCWVLRQNVVWLAAGVAVGVAGAAGLTRLLARYLFGVQPGDPAVFALVALVLVSVALAANAVPARRASRVHPAEALRHE